MTVEQRWPDFGSCLWHDVDVGIRMAHWSLVAKHVESWSCYCVVVRIDAAERIKSEYDEFDCGRR